MPCKAEKALIVPFVCKSKKHFRLLPEVLFFLGQSRKAEALLRRFDGNEEAVFSAIGLEDAARGDIARDDAP